MVENVRGEQIKVVNFHTRDFMGSIDIGNVIKIIALPDLNLVPEGPDYVIGMFNLAGKVIPVIDLSMRLKTSRPKQYSANTPIIICKSDKGDEFGLLVDKVNDISDVNSDILEISARNDKYVITGEIKYQDRISLLIDVNRIFDEGD